MQKVYVNVVTGAGSNNLSQSIASRFNCSRICNCYYFR